MVALTTCLEYHNNKVSFVCFNLKIGNILAYLYVQMEELASEKKREYFCTEMKDLEYNI